MTAEIPAHHNTILLAYRGSIAHGMFTGSLEENPDSIDDRDFMGVFLAGPSHYIGLRQEKETRELFVGDVDLVEYEYRHFVRLLLKSNPNVVGMLWLKEAMYLKVEEAGRQLIEWRDAFSSKLAYQSFCGYANSQLHKMHSTSGRGFRGEKRKELREKWGFDVKNAAHCIRLLRMGCEFLETGRMNVDRTGIDAEELLAVKQGAWSMERVVTESKRLFERAREAKERSPLPDQPDYGAADALVRETVARVVAEKQAVSEGRD